MSKRVIAVVASIMVGVGALRAFSPTPIRAALQQGAVVLEASQDNTLYEDVFGSLSNGSGDHLFAGRTAMAERRRTVIAFDLAPLAAVCPSGSAFLDAELGLTVNQAGTTFATNIAAHRITIDWGESTSNAAGEEGIGAGSQIGDATWMHNFYPTTLWTAAGGDFAALASATTLVDAEARFVWTSPAMLTDVEGWLASPATNFGWLLRDPEITDQTAKRFASRENPTVADRPALTVSCVPPPTVTGTPPTSTSTATATATQVGATISPTATPTGSATATRTPTATRTATRTATPTGSPSASPTGSATGTASPTGSPSASGTATATGSPTATATSSPTATRTATGSPTATPTATSSLTATPTSTTTGSATSTSTGSPTSTPTASASQTTTRTPTPASQTPTAGTSSPTAGQTGTPPTSTVTAGTPAQTSTATAPTPTPVCNCTPVPGIPSQLFLPVALKHESFAGTLRLVPDRPAVLTGETFQVRVLAEGLRPFVSIEVRIQYDPRHLEVVDADPARDGTQIAPGPFPPPEQTVPWMNNADSASGAIVYAVVLAESDPVNGGGTVALIPMRGLVPGGAHIGFELAVVGSALARRIPVATYDADIDILGESEATFTPTAPSPPASPTLPSPTSAATPGSETPTPVLTPTSGTPPATPGVPDACVHVLGNGGFEGGGTGWQADGSPPPVVVTQPVLAGARSLQLGLAGPPNVRGTSSAWQGFDVPLWASTITVGGWAWQRSTGPGGTDTQMLLLLAQDPAVVPVPSDPAGTVFRQVAETNSWRRWELTTGVRRFEAARMWIYAAVTNDGVGGRAWMNLDETRVALCP